MTTTQQVLTPTASRVLKRSLFWVGVALFGLLIAVISAVTAGTAGAGDPLDATNPAPGGAMAVAEVLRQQGVTVTATSTLEQTRQAVGDPATTTLFLYDDGLYLSDEQLTQAVGLADRVVIADATFGELAVAAPAVAQAGYVEGPLGADCDLPAVRKAGTVSGTASGFRLIDDTARATTCLGSGDGVYSLIQLPKGDGTLTILGATGALSNESVAENGNAALALNLLGQTQNLVWYLPTLADVPQTGPATLGELTPPWVTPVLVLLVLTFIAAAVWRGRRLGPLVVENLPVTVRASETMLGRARLYEKSSSRLRALDALRIGAIQRLAKACGLPRVATVDDVAAAVASLVRAQPGDIHRLLVDAVPQTDADLIALSDALLTLERDVARAIRP